MRTGPDFEETHTLRDGIVVHVRHIRPDDADELRRAFHRLSPTSRFRRFFGSIDDLDDPTVHYLTHVDGQNHVAIVAVMESPDLKNEIGIGVARFIRLPTEPDVAEAAVVVVDDFQSYGIGTLLCEVMAEAARERGITRFRAEVLASNEPARQLMHDVGANALREDDQSIVFDIPIPVPGGNGGAPNRMQHMIRRVLRAAARQVVGFMHLIGIPTEKRTTSQETP
jgi:GNAT superfamily N-acetyltransferase